jgi:hypothetical protein
MANTSITQLSNRKNLAMTPHLNTNAIEKNAQIQPKSVPPLSSTR